jgi:hypothetical protein
MAKDLECSVDYLVNESMRQYARSKNYGARLAPSLAPASQNLASQSLPSAGPPPRAAAPVQATPPSAVAPPRSTTGAPPPRVPPPPPRVASQVSPPRVSTPPPMPAPGRTLKSAAGANREAAPAAKPPTLSIVYMGQKFPVTKERFVLGRGRQTSDFTLKDPNVSRQHALIELQNGTYFMVDMGSTNGVEFNGQRVARKPIAEGDVYTICDHELVCTFR